MTSVFERFVKFTRYENGCWIWTGARRTSGYGVFKLNGKAESAHRVSYKLFKGDIPPGVFVCHTCDNPICVNPDHLFLGTASDNMMDAQSKGRLVIPEGIRFKKGHIPNFTTITKEQAVQVKLMIKKGMRNKDISEITGINYQTIVDIKRGKSFRNIVV